MRAVVLDKLQTACRRKPPELQMAVAAACDEVVRSTRAKKAI